MMLTKHCLNSHSCASWCSVPNQHPRHHLVSQLFLLMIFLCNHEWFSAGDSSVRTRVSHRLLKCWELCVCGNVRNRCSRAKIWCVITGTPCLFLFLFLFLSWDKFVQLWTFWPIASHKHEKSHVFPTLVSNSVLNWKCLYCLGVRLLKQKH